MRLKTRGSEFLYNLFTAPLLLPTIVLGLAILIIFAPLGLLGTFTGIALGHLVVTLPYGVRVHRDGARLAADRGRGSGRDARRDAVDRVPPHHAAADRARICCQRRR